MHLNPAGGVFVVPTGGTLYNEICDNVKRIVKYLKMALFVLILLRLLTAVLGVGQSTIHPSAKLPMTLPCLYNENRQDI